MKNKKLNSDTTPRFYFLFFNPQYITVEVPIPFRNTPPLTDNSHQLPSPFCTYPIVIP